MMMISMMIKQALQLILIQTLIISVAGVNDHQPGCGRVWPCFLNAAKRGFNKLSMNKDLRKCSEDLSQTVFRIQNQELELNALEKQALINRLIREECAIASLELIKLEEYYPVICSVDSFSLAIQSNWLMTDILVQKCIVLAQEFDYKMLMEKLSQMHDINDIDQRKRVNYVARILLNQGYDPFLLFDTPGAKCESPDCAYLSQVFYSTMSQRKYQAHFWLQDCLDYLNKEDNFTIIKKPMGEMQIYSLCRRFSVMMSDHEDLPLLNQPMSQVRNHIRKKLGILLYNG